MANFAAIAGFRPSGYGRALGQVAPRFSLSTDPATALPGWKKGKQRDDFMMRDAPSNTIALAPLLSLLRGIITSLETSRLYDIAPMGTASGENAMRRGELVLSCNENSISLESGVPFGPETKVTSVARSQGRNGQSDSVCFTLNGPRIGCWICSDRYAHPANMQPGESIFLFEEQATLLLGMLIEELLADKGGRYNIAKNLLHALLLTVEREVKRGCAIQRWAENETTEHHENDSDPIDHARQYIEAHLNQQLTLESVARQVYMSRAHFAKRFREQTGRTFTDYVNDCRLRQAESFLRETAWSVAHITEFVGFKSDSYFHRLFRREVGISPMEYRRQHQQGGTETR